MDRSLIGVSLDDTQPDSSAAPATLDFSGVSGSIGIDFESLSAEPKQTFFIVGP